MKETFELNKILIPIDFSETSKNALEHAAQICKKFDAKLHLMHVYTSFNMSVLPNIDVVGYQRNDSETKDLITEELNNIGNELNQKFNISYQIEVRDGSISKEIAAAAIETKADLIVMGTHGVSGFEEFFLGSNAYRTVTASTVPVLTVQGNAKLSNYDRILVPIDSSKHTRDKITQVVSFAKMFNSKVHLVGLITEEHEEERNIFNLKIKQIEEHFDNQGINYESEILNGDNIAEMTLKHSKKIDASLIVIMTEQEASTGLFIGPYAQRIVNHSKTPVLSVTPIQILQSFSQGQLAGDYRPFNV
tara:strand:+ start:1269 stop:2183 length:915 start_codon:yes stop_codon:yes gene_type:complete